MGYDATKTFEKNLNHLIEHNEANDQKSSEENNLLLTLNPIAFQLGGLEVHWLPDYYRQCRFTGGLSGNEGSTKTRY